MSSCLGLLLDSVRRRVKRVLANQNYLDKFYPHSLLTIFVQMAIACDEAKKFAMVWCNSDSILVNEIVAIKEIFETENKDDATWMAELLTNKYAVESVDRLIYLASTMKR